MYGNPCQPTPPPGACPPAQPPPTCPPDYCEPKDPQNTGPMALANLTQNAAGLGFPSCQKSGRSGPGMSGPACGVYRESQKKNIDCEMPEGVEQKAKEKAELRMSKLLQDTITPQIQKKKQEIEANECANEKLFARFRAANSFKEGCLNSTIFARRPIRGYTHCDTDFGRLVSEQNTCGKEDNVCPTYGDLSKTLVDSIANTRDYLDKYKNALEQSFASDLPCEKPPEQSYTDLVQKWIQEGVFSSEELNCIIEMAQSNTGCKK